MGLRSIFDGLYIDQLIRKDESGAFVIYPHGMLGRGYTLPAEQEPAMRLRLRWLMLASLIVGISFSSLLARITDNGAVTALGWVVIAGLGALLLSAIVFWQSRLASGLEPVGGPRMSTGEWLRRGRQSRPAWTLWFSAILGGIMTVASTAALIVGVTDHDGLVMVSGLFLLIISAVAGVDGVLGLIERGRQKK